MNARLIFRSLLAASLLATAVSAVAEGGGRKPGAPILDPKFGDRQTGSFGDIDQGNFGDQSQGSFASANFQRRQEGEVRPVEARPSKGSAASAPRVTASEAAKPTP